MSVRIRCRGGDFLTVKDRKSLFFIVTSCQLSARKYFSYCEKVITLALKARREQFINEKGEPLMYLKLHSFANDGHFQMGSYLYIWSYFSELSSLSIS